MAQPSVTASYNAQASDYEAFTINTPIGRLETELYLNALGDPTGLTILDLGGGTGLRARQAIERGAILVDVVDFSAQMLHVGKQAADKAELGDRIRWHEADVSKPLQSNPGLQGLEPSYDIVMANWVLDHANSIETLETMLANVAAYLKPGGRFICVHVTDPRSPALQGSKYGVTYSRYEEIPGGLKYWVTLHGTDPPVEFEGTSLEVLYSGSPELYEKFGLGSLKVMPFEETEIVKKDPEYWKEGVEQPIMRFVTALKEGE